MTDMESLDIRRPAPQEPDTRGAPWTRGYGKKWTEILGYRKEADGWRPGRVMAHMVNTTALRQLGEPAKRKRRWWPWLLAVYGTPIALAASLCAALWIVRHGL